MGRYALKPEDGVRQLAGEGVVVGELAVFAIHLVQYDRVPAGVALRRWDEILSRPAAEAEFFDDIDFNRCKEGANHDGFRGE